MSWNSLKSKELAAIETAPEDTEKNEELNEATPFWLAVAFEAVIVTVPPDSEVEIP